MKKYKVVKPFFDLRGLHKIGTLVELETPNAYVVLVEEEKAEEEKPKRKRGSKK